MGLLGRRAHHWHAEPDLPAHRAGGPGLSRGARRPTRLPGLVDSHCHLQHERFDADRDAVLDRARERGLERIMVPGWDLPSSHAALELADRHAPLIQAGVGVHPHHAGKMDEAGWRELESLAADEHCTAVGEIGLDFHRNLSEPDAQRAAFERQLDMAGQRGLPVLVHDREAHDAVAEALMRWNGRPDSDARGVLHAFSGDAALAVRLAGRGFLVSFALPLTFRSAVGPRAAATAIGADRCLVETDAPYLGPDRDRRNEPTTALRVAAELAHLRDEPVDGVVAAVRRAYDRLIETRASDRRGSA